MVDSIHSFPSDTKSTTEERNESKHFLFNVDDNENAKKMEMEMQMKMKNQMDAPRFIPPKQASVRDSNVEGSHDDGDVRNNDEYHDDEQKQQYQKPEENQSCCFFKIDIVDKPLTYDNVTDKTNISNKKDSKTKSLFDGSLSLHTVKSDKSINISTLSNLRNKYNDHDDGDDKGEYLFSSSSSSYPPPQLPPTSSSIDKELSFHASHVDSADLLTSTFLHDMSTAIPSTMAIVASQANESNKEKEKKKKKATNTNKNNLTSSTSTKRKTKKSKLSSSLPSSVPTEVQLGVRAPQTTTKNKSTATKKTLSNSIKFLLVCSFTFIIFITIFVTQKTTIGFDTEPYFNHWSSEGINIRHLLGYYKDKAIVTMSDMKQRLVRNDPQKNQTILDAKCKGEETEMGFNPVPTDMTMTMTTDAKTKRSSIKSSSIEDGSINNDMSDNVTTSYDNNNNNNSNALTKLSMSTPMTEHHTNTSLTLEKNKQESDGVLFWTLIIFFVSVVLTFPTDKISKSYDTSRENGHTEKENGRKKNNLKHVKQRNAAAVPTSNSSCTKIKRTKGTIPTKGATTTSTSIILSSSSSSMMKIDTTIYEQLRVYELRTMLSARNCKTSGIKSVLIQRLTSSYEDELQKYTVKELKSILKSKQHLKQSGTKQELIHRLIEDGL